ncbi:MAG: glycoside hydrolase family 47 protein [Syntrophothermus sp.]
MLINFKLFLLITALMVSTSSAMPAVRMQDTSAVSLSDQVKKEFLHAWKAYEKYAWGHDDLRPLSKTYRDWYSGTLLMTMVDSYDTMVLMGLNEEAEKTKAYIIENLSFDKDIYVKNFEITIRMLGGLISGYELSGDSRLLKLAEDLGKRLLPAFNSPTGMPYTFVNLKTGAVQGPETNPAEIGTLLLEFGQLSRHTGDTVYFHKAKNAIRGIYSRRSPLGLVGESINVETGKFINTSSHISGGIDSYYEYLLKAAILFGDKECLEMWNSSIASINKYLADEKGNSLWYGYADMYTGKRTETYYGALDAFFPAVLALSGDLKTGERLMQSAFNMWNVCSVEPEVFDYSVMQVKHPGYPLRPEIIESAYYLSHFTKNYKYVEMGGKMWNDFVRYCRTDEAYAALKNVCTKENSDNMQSFLFAETFKYYYLLFSDPGKFDFEKYIFNTEAHPLKRKIN